MKRVDDFRLRLGKHELVPIMIGGMGVDISTADLALEAARLGGVGHISDEMINTVADRRYDTKHVKEKLAFYKYNVNNEDKSPVKFDLGRLEEATRLHVEATMARKTGSGLVFINCMEKLTMNAPKETLKVRLTAALDAGIEGITLAAGLHLGSFALIEDHPRFRDAKLGIIVSSVRALQLFLKKNQRTNRLPDFIVVEGPLAGGHLGFGMDWAQYDLAAIVAEVLTYLRAEQLDIPVIPAGGIFTVPMRRNSSTRALAPCRLRHASPLLPNAACRTRSNRSISRPPRMISRSTRSRRLGIRCACSREAPGSAMASAPIAKPMVICSMPAASVPTSLPTTGKWLRILVHARSR